MKLLSFSYFFLLCLLPVGFAWATHHTFYVGPHHNYMRLTFNNPERLGGYTTGVTAGVTHHSCWFRANINYEGYFSTGDLHGSPCQTSRVQEHLLAWNVGGCWQACDSFSLTGYVGVGFNRFLNHQDPSTQECPEVDGLKYKYSKITLPVTVDLGWWITENSKLSLYARWRPDVYARLHVLGCTLKNERNHAARVALPFHHTLACHEFIYFEFEPFFDWSRFGKVCATNSNGTPFQVPDLTRWDLGVRVSVGFKF